MMDIDAGVIMPMSIYMPDWKPIVLDLKYCSTKDPFTATAPEGFDTILGTIKQCGYPQLIDDDDNTWVLISLPRIRLPEMTSFSKLRCVMYINTIL